MVPDLLRSHREVEQGLPLGHPYWHTGVWNKPVSEQMNSLPGSQAKGGPSIWKPFISSLWSSSQKASSSRKPPPDLSSLEFQGLLSPFYFGIEKITDFSSSLTLDVTLSRQAPLLSGPQFPHPLNVNSGACLKGNHFKVWR